MAPIHPPDEPHESPGRLLGLSFRCIFPAHAGWLRLLENVVTKKVVASRARRVPSCSPDHRHVMPATSLMSGRNGQGQAATFGANVMALAPHSRSPWSRDTIPYPPTPHHDCAKADNDRDQDRQDGDSCIVLILPVAEWVSWCATGFERHTSSDSQIESRCRQSYKNAEGEELRVSPQVDDRSRST